MFTLIIQIKKLKENCHQYNDHQTHDSLALISIPLDLITRDKQHLLHLRRSSPKNQVYQYERNYALFLNYYYYYCLVQLD